MRAKSRNGFWRDLSRFSPETDQMESYDFFFIKEANNST